MAKPRTRTSSRTEARKNADGHPHDLIFRDDSIVVPYLRKAGGGYNLLVETVGGLCYNVATEREGAAMRRFAAGLKPPSFELSGISFRHHERLLYLTEDMERMLGVPIIDYHEFEVVRIFNENSRFVLGRTYTPSLDPEKRSLSTAYDHRLNEQRKLDVVSRWTISPVTDDVAPSSEW